MFLGPYDGRSPEIIPYLRGVLTNPNCEFEANYIPLHTLAQWSKSNAEGVKKDIIAGWCIYMVYYIFPTPQTQSRKIIINPSLAMFQLVFEVQTSSLDT